MRLSARSLVVVAALSFAATALTLPMMASTFTYTYTGHDYNDIIGSSLFNTSEDISGSITLATALPDSQALTAVTLSDIVSFSFTDCAADCAGDTTGETFTYSAGVFTSSIADSSGPPDPITGTIGSSGSPNDNGSLFYFATGTTGLITSSFIDIGAYDPTAGYPPGSTPHSGPYIATGSQQAGLVSNDTANSGSGNSGLPNAAGTGGAEGFSPNTDYTGDNVDYGAASYGTSPTGTWAETTNSSSVVPEPSSLLLLGTGLLGLGAIARRRLAL